MVKHYRGGKLLLKEKILKSNKNNCGYSFVLLHKNGIGKQFYVHRLIAGIFIPNLKNKPCVNHKNGIKTDNRVENLEWCTPKENNEHAFKIGLKDQTGERHNRSKLTNRQVRVIKHCINLKMINSDIAKYFPTIPSNIGNIRTNNTWAHIKI